MKSINFDNPYLLLLIIPFVLLLLAPYFLAFKRRRKAKSVVISLVIHLVIAVLIPFALAGTTFKAVITETNVFVVADVSYSAEKNLDTVDEYIGAVKENLPRNSKMGLVCFGKDRQLVSGMGEKLVSVKEATVDDSATDIVGALEYTATLFEEDVIKRIVLITDGKDTDTAATGKLITAIENLYAQNIKIDAIYLDDNISPDAKEVQLTGVDFVPGTYTGREVTADVFVQSSYDARAIVSLYHGEQKVADKAVELTRGSNVVNFPLLTEEAGSYDYEVRVVCDEDESDRNNSYRFTQEVTSTVKILLIAPTEADKTAIEALYGEDAQIDAYIGRADVPYTVEDLCLYDEIILSNTDVRQLENTTAFVEALDKAVSQFGKSLLTVGNTEIQNKADETDLSKLEDMIPVRFGNNDQDPKLYGIVIDTSRSMQMASRLIMLKEAAIQLLDLFGPDDYVTVVSFAGEITVLQSPTKASNRKEIAKAINDVQPTQGTYLGKGMQTAYELMKNHPCNEKQVILISDGASYGLEPDDPVAVAGEMLAAGIPTSVIDPQVMDTEYQQVLMDIAKAGSPNGTKGEYAFENYYRLEGEETVRDVIFNEVADEITESVIEGQFAITVQKAKDEVMNGVTALPDLYGYVYAKAKASATTVLTTVYERESGNIDAPVYAYWKYGNGQVAAFTGALSGEWVDGWAADTNATAFLQNVIETNIPEESVHYPYTLSTEFDGAYLVVELTPAVINPYASAEATITMPSGEKLVQRLTFDSSKYFYRFPVDQVGKYGVEIVYAYDEHSYTSQTVYNVSYSPEYDRFAVFDISTLYSTIRDRGTVSDNAVPDLENEESEVATFEFSFDLPFMVLSIVLYLADIIIRKLKWEDITGLFKKRKKGGA